MGMNFRFAPGCCNPCPEACTYLVHRSRLRAVSGSYDPDTGAITTGTLLQFDGIQSSIGLWLPSKVNYHFFHSTLGRLSESVTVRSVPVDTFSTTFLLYADEAAVSRYSAGFTETGEYAWLHPNFYSHSDDDDYYNEGLGKTFRDFQPQLFAYKATTNYGYPIYIDSVELMVYSGSCTPLLTCGNANPGNLIYDITGATVQFTGLPAMDSGDLSMVTLERKFIYPI